MSMKTGILKAQEISLKNMATLRRTNKQYFDSDTIQLDSHCLLCYLNGAYIFKGEQLGIRISREKGDFVYLRLTSRWTDVSI